MEPDPRAKAGADRLRPLNSPRPVTLELSPGGVPARVEIQGRKRRVLRVEEIWRVEEGWWRGQEVARVYFRLALEEGGLLTVYNDRNQGGWWSQRY